MGCGSSNTASNDDPPIDPIDVDDIYPTYPEPKPPQKKKDAVFKLADYAAIDKKAMQMSKAQVASYEELSRALTAECKTDMEKARALFVWLFHQDVYGSFYPGVRDPHTPRGYMKLIKTRKGSYATFYALLCRSADIPCCVIRGVSKGDQYAVGQSHVRGLEGAWCALYIGGSWRFVHPRWAYFMEKHALENGQTAPGGTRRASINEFYWLTDPMKMICFHMAKAEPWQLLKAKWDQKKFLDSPQFTEDYFTSGLLLPRKYSAVVNSENGVCVIDLDHDEFEQLQLEARVMRLEEEQKGKGKTTGGGGNQGAPAGNNSKTKPNNNSQSTNKGNNQGKSGQGQGGNNKNSVSADYIAVARSSTRKSVLVRLPGKGSYNGEIFGGKSAMSKIVEFRFECFDNIKDAKPFPFNTGEGYGLLLAADQLGISDLVPDSGLVLVKNGQKMMFSLTTTQAVEAKAALKHRDTADQMKYQGNIRARCTDDQIVVDLVVPEDLPTEFGLEISARTKNSNRPYTAVATYLLVDENWRKKTAVVQPTVGGEKVRQALVNATQRSDVARLEQAIDEFVQLRLADEGDLTRAKERLIELHLYALRKATKERKLEDLDKAIEAARNSNVSEELKETKEMADAEACRRQLGRLKLYMHKVLELNQKTISEIHSYARPRPLVHKVMQATFRLLGEPRKKVMDWGYIRTNMRALGRNSVINRIRRRDLVDVKAPQARDAEQYLGQTNKIMVRLASAGASTFYIWSNNMVSEFQGRGTLDPTQIWGTTPREDPWKKAGHTQNTWANRYRRNHPDGNPGRFHGGNSNNSRRNAWGTPRGGHHRGGHHDRGGHHRGGHNGRGGHHRGGHHRGRGGHQRGGHHPPMENVLQRDAPIETMDSKDSLSEDIAIHIVNSSQNSQLSKNDVNSDGRNGRQHKRQDDTLWDV